MIRATLLIVGKDLRIQLRNRTVLLLGFAAPLALAFVLSTVFGGIDDPNAPVTFDVAVADLDGGEVAGMALFFVFFTAGLLLVSILDERSRGTLDRLLVAPIPSA